jgi:hypothetical protein
VIDPRPIRELTIEGGRYISAASGLAHTGDHIYVVADDERELGVFPAQGMKPGRLERFLPGELPADPEERKRHKPDLEALALLPGALLALESGSKPQRRGGVLWQLDERGKLAGEPQRLDLTGLYDALDREIPDLNIEGATVAGARLILFQRGNGRGAVNAAVTLELAGVERSLAEWSIDAGAIEEIRRHDLGEVDGVRLCFSDATALPDGSILFTAVAEGGDDTYQDGQCVGAGIGMLDAAGELSGFDRLEPGFKVEGIEVHHDGAETVVFLVADADDPSSPSVLLGAPLPQFG